MRKTYRYRNLIYPVANDSDVNFTVEFISDGNSGQTLVNIPGPKDPEIDNSGTKFLGKGKELRGDTTISVSDIANLVPDEDEIRIRYKINGEILVEHQNPNSEEESLSSILFIKFPAP